MLSDIEVTLDTGIKDAFGSPLAGAPSPMPATQGDNTIMGDDAPSRFPVPLNSTFFVKADTDDDSLSFGSADPPSALMFEAEQKMRDSIRAIQFKEMLLARDKHSREVILRRCVEWLQMPTSRRSNKTLDWFMSLSALKTTDSLENSYLWHTLHENIYASESFKTVISFFDAL